MSTLGPRHWYKYTSDDTHSYKIQTQDYLAEAAGLELNDSLPTLPKRYYPRYVWLEAKDKGPRNRPIRKKLVIQRADDPRFRAGSTVTVAGTEMLVKGYIGEIRTGTRNT